MSMKLTIIGGGPGGYTAAFAAAHAGMSVTLIEKEHLGGTCLNRGCIPTKTLKASADALDMALRLSEFGIHCQDVHLDMSAVIARKNSVRQVLRQGLEQACAKHKVTLLRGVGRVISSSLVSVTLTDGTCQDVCGDALIIATGSRTMPLPALNFDHKYVINSDDALDLEHIPQHICIVGGGVMGCEMAFIYRAFGAKVTLVEGLDRILPLPDIDTDISKLLQREMKKRGIICETGRILQDIQVNTTDDTDKARITATLTPSPFLAKHTPAQSKEKLLEADVLLVTVGRTPCTEDLGLSSVGVITDERGWIVADAFMQSSVSHIYAIGDVLGPSRSMLAHTAAAEGLCALQHIIATANGTTSCPMDYTGIPSAIFTSPEVGCVGMSEAQAVAAGIEVHCPTVQMRTLGKAQAMGELPGFFKIIAEKESHKVLGAHIAGAHATELMAELSLALHMNATLEDITKTIHAHPTLAEGVFEAALLGSAFN